MGPYRSRAALALRTPANQQSDIEVVFLHRFRPHLLGLKIYRKRSDLGWVSIFPGWR